MEILEKAKPPPQQKKEQIHEMLRDFVKPMDPKWLKDAVGTGLKKFILSLKIHIASEGQKKKNNSETPYSNPSVSGAFAVSNPPNG